MSKFPKFKGKLLSFFEKLKNFHLNFRHLQTIRRAATKKPSKDITTSVIPNLDRSISMPPPAADQNNPQNLNQINNNLTSQGKMLPPLNTNLATNNSRESDIDITPTELKESIGKKHALKIYDQFATNSIYH